MRDRDGDLLQADAGRAGRGAVVEVDLRLPRRIREDLDISPPDPANAKPQDLAHRLLRRPATGDLLRPAAAVAILRGGQDPVPEPLRVAAEHRDDAVDVDQVNPNLVPAHYSTVTDLARLRGWSTSVPRATATS